MATNQMMSNMGLVQILMFVLLLFVSNLFVVSLGNPVGSYILAEPVLTCPEGYMMTGKGDCETLEFTEGSFSCDKKSITNGDGSCALVELIEPEYICEDGVIGHHGKKSSCLIREYIQPSISCAKEYTVSADGMYCIHDKKQKLELMCPEAYKLEKGTCVQKLSVPAMETCPEGYLLHSEGHGKTTCLFVEQRSPELSCAKGLTLSGGNCVKQERRKIEVEKCPKGSKPDEKNGQCLLIDYVDSEVLCDTGSLGKDGKYCEYIDQRPMLPYCKQKEYFFNGAECIRDIVRDIVFECPDGYKKSHDGKHGDILCVASDSIEPSVVCPDGSVMQGKECIMYMELMPTYECPKKGGFLHDVTMDECVDTIITEPELHCPKGYKSDHMDSTLCIREKTIEAIATCPGQAVLNGKYCEYSTQTPALPYCKKDAELTPTGCVSNKKGKKPKVQCPAGFKLSHHTNECLATDYYEPNAICPPDTVPMDDGKYCESFSTSLPSFSCPKKYHFDQMSMQCISNEFADPSLICPPSYVLDGGLCYMANFTYGEEKKGGKSHGGHGGYSGHY